MFDICGCHFNYAGFDSSMYDLIFARMDTDELTIFGGEQELQTVYSKRNNKHLLTSVRYSSDQFSFDAEIFQRDAKPIDASALREIERTLFGRHSYGQLYIIDSYDIDPQSYINCVFLNPERIKTQAGTVGYKCTVVLDSVMAYEPAITSTFTSSSFDITLDTDLNDYTYPTVSITTTSGGGSITIKNMTDSTTRTTGFSGVPGSTTFTMDCSTNRISNNMYDYFTTRNFIRLLDGTNSFSVTGAVSSISFTYNNRIYL